MDHYSLKLFVHLSDTLHFGKTASACFISPSALSRHIKRLEEEVGHRLFERDRRSVQLTPEGEIFRTYAREVLDRWRDVSNRLNEASGSLHGEISIYCSVTAAYSILPNLLGEFRRAYPQIHLNIHTGDAASAVRRLVADEIDLVIAARPDSLPEGLLYHELTTTRLIFIAPRDSQQYDQLLTRDPVPWREIPLILAEQGLARRRLDAWFRSIEIQPNIYANVSGNEAILTMVSLGAGVGLVNELVLAKSPLQDNVRQLDLKHPLEPYSVGLVTKQRKLLQRQVRALWDLAENQSSRN